VSPDTLSAAGYRPLVEITRGYPGLSGEIPESVHFGALAVVDSAGETVASAGDPALVTFLRSSAKPLQALPLIQAGGRDAFGLTQAEIALACGSHSGTDVHAAAVRLFQAKTGVVESDLHCGTHPSFHQPTAAAMLLRGEKLSDADSGWAVFKSSPRPCIPNNEQSACDFYRRKKYIKGCHRFSN
jgi:L-asparaginase II